MRGMSIRSIYRNVNRERNLTINDTCSTSMLNSCRLLASWQFEMQRVFRMATGLLLRRESRRLQDNDGADRETPELKSRKKSEQRKTEAVFSDPSTDWQKMPCPLGAPLGIMGRHKRVLVHAASVIISRQSRPQRWTGRRRIKQEKRQLPFIWTDNSPPDNENQWPTWSAHVVRPRNFQSNALSRGKPDLFFCYPDATVVLGILFIARSLALLFVTNFLGYLGLRWMISWVRWIKELHNN